MGSVDGTSPVVESPGVVVEEGSGHRLGLMLFSAAAVALGHALQVNNGNLHPDSMLWLTVAAVCCVVGVGLPSRARLERLGEVALVGVLGAGLAFELSELLTAPPGMYVRYAPGWHVSFFRGLAVAAVISGSLLPRARAGWLKHLQVLVLLGSYLSLGLWMLQASPAPNIDVYVFQRDASAALLRGENPYALTFPNIYGTTAFYGPGLSVNGRLIFGFPYPPLSLLLALPGHALGGDYRYAQLLAMAGAAALMSYMRPGRLGALAAALFLLTPRGLFVLEQGWTEPFAVLLLSAVAFCACRWPRALPYALGLLLAVKQYMVLAAPLALLLLPRPLTLRSVWELAWRAGAVALAVSLPLVLWNVPAFVHSAVTLQFHQPFRTEALSYLAWIASRGGERPSEALSLVAAVVAGALALWRAPRTPSGFGAAVALVYFGFFAFNKQAFCNYYYLVFGALYVTVAAAGDRVTGSERTPAE